MEIYIIVNSIFFSYIIVKKPKLARGNKHYIIIERYSCLNFSSFVRKIWQQKIYNKQLHEKELSSHHPFSSFTLSLGLKHFLVEHEKKKSWILSTDWKLVKTVFEDSKEKDVKSIVSYSLYFILINGSQGLIKKKFATLVELYFNESLVKRSWPNLCMVQSYTWYRSVNWMHA